MSILCAGDRFLFFPFFFSWGFYCSPANARIDLHYCLHRSDSRQRFEQGEQDKVRSTQQTRSFMVFPAEPICQPRTSSGPQARARKSTKHGTRGMECGNWIVGPAGADVCEECIPSGCTALRSKRDVDSNIMSGGGMAGGRDVVKTHEKIWIYMYLYSISRCMLYYTSFIVAWNVSLRRCGEESVVKTPRVTPRDTHRMRIFTNSRVILLSMTTSSSQGRQFLTWVWGNHKPGWRAVAVF